MLLVYKIVRVFLYNITNVLLFLFSNLYKFIFFKRIKRIKKDNIIIIKIMGGLGNQMFQYAKYIEMESMLDKKKGIVLIDKDYYDDNRIHNGYELEKIFNVKLPTFDDFIKKKLLFFYYNIKLVKKIRLFTLIDKLNLIGLNYTVVKDEQYLTGFADCCLSNIQIYDGFWTSKQYWQMVDSKVHQAMEFPQIKDSFLIDVISDIEHSESVSVHIRRGDYVSNKSFELLTEQYYTDAFDVINNRIKRAVYFVFSDDLIYAKKMISGLKLTHNRFVFVDSSKNKNYIDLQLMSMCKHNIIANSTFSWWGAELNRNLNKIVVAPDKYYTIIPSNKLWNKLINSGYFYQNDWIKV